jgi:hypothetical protein
MLIYSDDILLGVRLWIFEASPETIKTAPNISKFKSKRSNKCPKAAKAAKDLKKFPTWGSSCSSG